QVDSAKSAADLTGADFNRARELFEAGVIGESLLDERRTAHERAQAAVRAAEEQLELVRSGSRRQEIEAARARLAQAEAELLRLESGARAEEIAAQRAAVEAGRAQVERIRVQLEETIIAAPAEAIVETLDLEPGDLLRAGQVAAVLNLPNRTYVRCYVPENRLGEVGLGDEVTLRVDSFPGEEFTGVVRHINQEAEFTPRNVQTSEKRAELVF